MHIQSETIHLTLRITAGRLKILKVWCVWLLPMF